MLALWHTLVIMFFTSFLIQYYIMSYIMIDKTDNFTNSLGKMYISFAMAFSMAFIELCMNDYAMNTTNWSYYFPLLLLFGVSVYLYRHQKFIYDKQYLEEMIEHHSMALLTSKKIIEKTQNRKISDLAKTIMKSQHGEIEYMRFLLDSPNL